MPDSVRIHEVTPPTDVLDYFRGRKLAPAFSWLDVWGQEHAHAFTVAKAVDVDVLAAFRGTIDDAIARGLGYEEWRAQLQPKLASLGWWGPRTVEDADSGARKPVDFSSPRRLQNIFWSNMRAARAAGQWERAQASKDVLPYLLYVETTAADPRQEHLEWVGTLLPIDHEFWATHFPPNGWGCQCAVRQVGRAEAKRLGGVSPDPVMRTRIFENRRTGERVEVPVGIDPGWHTNPGKSRSVGLARVLADKIGRIEDPMLRAVAVETVVLSAEFAKLIAGKLAKRIALPVATLAEPPAGAASSVALLSTETAIKQLAKHPEVIGRHYELLPDFLRTAERIEAGRITNFVGTLDGRPWHLVVKRTGAGDALYVTTFHRITADDIARIRRQAQRRHDEGEN
jgi:hypothetical protein